MLLTSVESESGVSKVGCKVGGCRQGRKRERCTEYKCTSQVVRFYSFGKMLSLERDSPVVTGTCGSSSDKALSYEALLRATY